MTAIGIDPGAIVRLNGEEQFAEVYLHRNEDGTLLLVGETDAEEFSVLLRADFLDAVIAQARASEQSAA